MQTKLTLRLKDTLIVAAKNYAENTGKSLSQVVSDYFQALQQKVPMPENMTQLPPLTKALKGVLKSKPLFDQNAYKKHLEEKYL